MSDAEQPDRAAPARDGDDAPDAGGASDGEDAATGPKQVDIPDYHSRNHTAAQTCGWTA
ncbi:MAG: 4-demethylwyosine synthase TYW1, partial [Halobacteriaceae archaeon]